MGKLLATDQEDWTRRGAWKSNFLYAPAEDLTGHDYRRRTDPEPADPP